jgi:hypothetical protein
MHRSGTSLVANLLRLCGLYLGAEQDLMPATHDNRSGYWENQKFLTLNDALLAKLGGRWDLPPIVTDGWAEDERFSCLRAKAETLLEEFRNHEPWGWKDPRTSLTLPFWISLGGLTIPFWDGSGSKLKVVLCVRNPGEVFYSLRDREYTPNATGLNLWLIYNQNIVTSTLPTDRIVTHYESYFQDAEAELRRVLSFLEISPSTEMIERSILAISEKLRHHRFRESPVDEMVDPAISNLYQMLCQEANYREAVGVTN